jgi:CRP-like cAMP-binding protein
MSDKTEGTTARFTWLEWGKHTHPGREGAGGELRLGEREYLWLEKGLKGLGLFEKLDLRSLATLLPYMRLFAHPKGAELCREGEPGDRLFLIYRGEVEVLKNTGLFKEQPLKLAKLGAGEFFGEMALLFNEPRNATCRTTRPSLIFSLGYEDFHRVLKKHAAVRRRVKKVATERLKKLSKAWGHH